MECAQAPSPESSMIDMHPPPAYVQMAQAEEAPNPDQPPQIEVKPLDVGRYLPDNAMYATIIITVTPPTGTIVIYTPGYEGSPVVFRGPKTSGEIHLNGPTVYVHLEDGATDFEVQYLEWRVQ
jgi:hypothetical protein